MKPFIRSKSRAEAVAKCPGAVAVVKVEGGYMCFESIDDYRRWLAIEKREGGPAPQHT